MARVVENVVQHKVNFVLFRLWAERGKETVATHKKCLVDAVDQAEMTVNLSGDPGIVAEVVLTALEKLGVKVNALQVGTGLDAGVVIYPDWP